jgi:microcystin-dependent protein
MSTLAVTNTFVAGTIITASGHNQNFSDIIAWANGNIGSDNLDTLTDTVTWNVTTNVLGLDITNVGTEGSIKIIHNATLASGKSVISMTSSSAQTVGLALVNFAASSASNGIPVLRISDAGAGGSAFSVLSTTKPSIPAPKVTTVQRNAMTALAEGMEIYNSTTKRKEIYDGTNWVDSAGRTGEIVDYGGGVIPPDRILADGSVKVRTDYPALFARYGTTYNTGGEAGTDFRIPDCAGRATIGVGTGSGLTARALGDKVGAETHVLTLAEIPEHDHGGGGDHTHNASADNAGGHQHNIKSDGSGGVIGYALSGASAGNSTAYNDSAGLHAHNISVSMSGALVTNEGSDDPHNNMQPSIAFNKCIII